MTRLRDADDPRSRHVYYCYAADGTLLYIGQCMDPVDRLVRHGHYSSPSFGWFYHCTRVEIGPSLPDMTAARATERDEIRRLRPAFNTHHNPAPNPWTPPTDAVTRPYLSLPDITWRNETDRDAWLLDTA